MEPRNGRLSDQYCIGTDTGCIVSNRLLLYRPILRASLQVQQQLLTGGNTQQIQGHSRPSPAARAPRMIQDTGEGWRGERRETVT